MAGDLKLEHISEIHHTRARFGDSLHTPYEFRRGYLTRQFGFGASAKTLRRSARSKSVWVYAARSGIRGTIMGDKVLMLVVLSLGLVLVLTNAKAANDILNALGTAYTTQLKTLQGR